MQFVIAQSLHINPFMNKQIDIKSALIGLCVGVLVMLGIAATSGPGSLGRYQIAGTDSYGLVVDTQTGEVWCAAPRSFGGKATADFYKPKLGVQD